MFTEMKQAATVDMTYHFMALEELNSADSEDYYLYHAETHSLRDGYADESATLWNRRGVMLGRSRQLIAVF